MSCRIFLGCHVEFFWENCFDFSPPPPWTPFFFVGIKNIFRIFRKKISKYVFNEIDCRKFLKFFSMTLTVKIFIMFFQEINCKNFWKCFSMKLILKILEIFYSQFPWKTFSKFFTVNFIEKTFWDFFWKIWKMFFCQEKKGGIMGGGKSGQLFQGNPT